MTVGNDFGDLLRHCPTSPNVILKHKLRITLNPHNGTYTLLAAVGLSPKSLSLSYRLDRQTLYPLSLSVSKSTTPYNSCI
jgi:hypothetical protein